METPSSSDPSKGFTVTNNTTQNVYLQTGTSTFEKILPGKTSTAQTASQDYPVRNNNDTNAAVYLTVSVSDSNGSLTVNPGTERGKFVVTSNFAN
jgi:hypothetical protein